MFVALREFLVRPPRALRLVVGAGPAGMGCGSRPRGVAGLDAGLAAADAVANAPEAELPSSAGSPEPCSPRPRFDHHTLTQE